MLVFQATGSYQLIIIIDYQLSTNLQLVVKLLLCIFFNEILLFYKRESTVMSG